MTSARSINQIKLNLAAKSLAKKIVYLPEPGELCSCFFTSRLASESMNVNPQNPRRTADQRGRWRTVFLPPPTLWQSGRHLFPGYLKCTFPSCTAHFYIAEMPVPSSALPPAEQKVSSWVTLSLGAQWSPPRPLPLPSCLSGSPRQGRASAPFCPQSSVRETGQLRPHLPPVKQGGTLWDLICLCSVGAAVPYTVNYTGLGCGCQVPGPAAGSLNLRLPDPWQE